MKRSGPLPRAAAAVCALHLLAAPAAAWVATVNGIVPATDFGNALAFDAQGNVLAGGRTVELGLALAFTVVKYAPDGTELWRTSVPGTALRAGEGGGNAIAAAVDPAGHVVAAGLVTNAGTGGDFFVVKLDGATGAVIWQVAIDGGGRGDIARTVAVDAAGDVIAGGNLDPPTGREYAVVKLAGATGAELWRRVRSGTAAVGADTIDELALDSAGDVVAVGNVQNTTTGRDLLAEKLSGSTGNPLWTKEVDGGDNSTDTGSGVAVGPGDVVAVSGTLDDGPNGRQFAVIRYTSAGTESWRRVIDGTASGRTDAANAVVFDPVGNVIAVGETENTTTGRDMTVVKLVAATGNTAWLRTASRSNDAQEDAYDVATDPLGDVTVVGRTFGTSYDFTVARYTSLGVNSWTTNIDGSRASSFDEPSRVLLDAVGDAVAIGSVADAATGLDLFLVRLAAATGAEVWRRTINGTGGESFDRADAVATDAWGDVVSAGTTREAGSGMSVAKHAGADGSLLWHTRLGGTAGFGTASGVAVDAAGDVFAAGRLENSGTGDDFAIVKLAGGVGSEFWRYTTTGPEADSRDGANALALDPSGNPVAAGVIEDDTTGADFAVVKVDGASGGELWRQVFDGSEFFSSDSAVAVAVDGTGHVLAGGVLVEDATGQDFALLKLDGATGVEQWRFLVDGPGPANASDRAQAVAVDGAGDVVGAGYLGNADRSLDFFVVKVGGADHTERWRATINGAAPASDDQAWAVQVDAAGDVLAAGEIEDVADVTSAIVVKLAAATGAEVWRATVGGAADDVTAALALALAPGGDAIAAGRLATDPSNFFSTFLLARFAAASGAEVWRRAIVVDGGSDAAQAVGLDGVGNVVAAGLVDVAGLGSDFAAAKVSGTTGADAFCGNGVREDPERCDDGNLAGGDCCTPTCEPTEVAGICGGPCTAAAECGDGDPCTDDTCDPPALRCEHPAVAGTASVVCAFERAFTGPGCGKVPRAIRKKFKRAGKLARKATKAKRAKRAQRLYARSDKCLMKVERRIAKAEKRKKAKRRLAADCAAALRALVGDARGRVAAFRQ